MTKSKTMTVTNNVNYCLDTLKKVVSKLPASEAKTEATNAINYLINTSKGISQIRRGRDCNDKIVIPPWKLEKTNPYFRPKP